MLEGRNVELVRLGELLAELRDGLGRSLLLRGEPGIGKTALLAELMRRCGDDVTILHVSGVQTEADLAFAALSELLAPVLDGLAELPPPQADALRAALALGPPSEGDRLAVCVATVGLLQFAARARPVLVVVDDVQWLDAASREAIRFAARRASGGVAVVLAARDPEHDHRSGPGLPTVRIGPLSPTAARAVLGRIAPDLAPPVAAALVDAAAGVPLAFVELPATLSGGQRAGAEPLDLPLSPGARLRDVITRRTAVLGSSARQILLLLAADGECDVDLLATASAGTATDIDALDEAEARGLVRVRGGRVSFAHPLIRSVIWGSAASSDRRMVHKALAAVSSGEARAWHLAAATVGPDEQVAAELERAAGAAAARRGYASAATALERAAELSPDADDRARRTCAAGEAAAAAGLSARASSLLDQGARATTDTTRRVRTTRLHSLVRMRGGQGQGGGRPTPGRGRPLDRDDQRAVTMLADAAFAIIHLGEFARAVELAERAVRLLADSDDPLARAHALAVFGWCLVLRGRNADARPALAEAELLAGPLDPLRPASVVLLTALNWWLPTGEFERALHTAQAPVERRQAAGQAPPSPPSSATSSGRTWRVRARCTHGVSGCWLTTTTRRSPTLSHGTTAVPCRSSGRARSSRTAGGCTASAGARTRGSSCARSWRASTGSAPRRQ